jgi:hypothetical protein
MGWVFGTDLFIKELQLQKCRNYKNVTFETWTFPTILNVIAFTPSLFFETFHVGSPVDKSGKLRAVSSRIKELVLDLHFLNHVNKFNSNGLEPVYYPRPLLWGLLRVCQAYSGEMFSSLTVTSFKARGILSGSYDAFWSRLYLCPISKFLIVALAHLRSNHIGYLEEIVSFG